MRFCDIESKFCLSCLYAVTVTAALWLSGEPYNAIFFFAAISMLIAGWKSGGRDYFMLGVVIFVAWTVNTLVYFLFQEVQPVELFGLAISDHRIVYFTALFAHSFVALLAFDAGHRWLSAIASLMGLVALTGLISNQLMPWRALGNVLFLIQALFFVSTSLYHRWKPAKAARKNSTKNVVKIEVAHGSDRRTVAGAR